MASCRTTRFGSLLSKLRRPGRVSSSQRCEQRDHHGAKNASKAQVRAEAKRHIRPRPGPNRSAILPSRRRVFPRCQAVGEARHVPVPDRNVDKTGFRCFVPDPPFCVPCPPSCVLCPVSCVLCSVSCVLCPVSCVLCPVSCVLCPVPRPGAARGTALEGSRIAGRDSASSCAPSVDLGRPVGDDQLATHLQEGPRTSTSFRRSTWSRTSFARATRTPTPTR